VRYLMKSAGKKAVGKEDLVAATLVAARQVFWIRRTKAKARSIPCEEQAIEQIDDLLRLPCGQLLALEHPHIYRLYFMKLNSRGIKSGLGPSCR